MVLLVCRRSPPQRATNFFAQSSCKSPWDRGQISLVTRGTGGVKTDRYKIEVAVNNVLLGVDPLDTIELDIELLLLLNPPPQAH